MYNELVKNVRPDGGADPFCVFLAGITYPDKSYRITRKVSAVWVFEYVIRGAGHVRINDLRFPVCAGEVYILPKGAQHDYFADEYDPFEKIWFNADGDLIPHLLSLYGLSGIFKIEAAHLHGMFERFLAQCGKDPENPCDGLALLFHQIVQELESAPRRDPPTTRHSSYAGISIKIWRRK